MKQDPRRYSHERFAKLIANTYDQLVKLSELKGGEYAGDDDRLANFRRNALALGLPMESIWAVYCAKHWDAVMQYIQDKNSGKTRTRMEPIAGRVDDIIVYMILFKAMLDEDSDGMEWNAVDAERKTGDDRTKLTLKDMALKGTGQNQYDSETEARLRQKQD